MNNNTNNWRSDANSYKQLLDDFKVVFRPPSNPSSPTKSYMGKDSTIITGQYPENSYSCEDLDSGISLRLDLLHYSKYYTISNYVSKNVSGLVPLVTTVDDLDKYNLAKATNGSLYAKTHMSLLMSGQGSTGSANVVIWYRDYQNDSYQFSEGKWLDLFVVADIWDVDSGLSRVYKGTYFDCMNYLDTLFSQFVYENCQPFYFRQNGGTDKREGGINGTLFNGRNLNLTDGDNCLMRSGFFTYNLYLSKPGSVSKNNKTDYEISSSNLGNDHDTNTDTFDTIMRLSDYGLGFVDKNHNLHLFNTYARYYGYNYMGYLLDALTKIYVLKDLTTRDVLTASDIVYLLDNYTLYTQDAIYEYASNGQLKDNQLITIYDYNYIKYISAILDKVSANLYIDEYEFKDTAINNITISANNINFTLKYSSRNVPLEFKMNYRKPNTQVMTEQDDAKLVLTDINGNLILVTTDIPINNSTLYYKNSDSSVTEIDGGLSLLDSSIGNIPAGKLSVSENNLSISRSSGFHLVFKYNGEYLEFVTTKFSPSDNHWSIGQNYNGYVGTIRDLLYKDVLFSGTQLVPQNQ